MCLQKRGRERNRYVNVPVLSVEGSVVLGWLEFSVGLAVSMHVGMVHFRVVYAEKKLCKGNIDLNNNKKKQN